MNKEIPKTFCILPWVHRFTNIGGEIQVCCSSEEYDNNILDNNGKRMHISDCADANEILNSEYMKKIRMQMLNGKWPSICNRCKVTEELGGLSRRYGENIHFAEFIEPELSNVSKVDGALEKVNVISQDYRLGNICNLACRMCNPRSSSSWIRDWQKIDQDLFVVNDESIKEFKNIDWFEQPKILEEFEKEIHKLKHLHFAGGEPLIVPLMQTMLEKCVKSGYAKNIQLSYNTNFTKVSDSLKVLWPRFKRVSLLVSVDGFGSLNEFIRYPSKWETIDRNLRDIDENFHKYGISEVFLMCTLQVYNVFYMEEFYDYLVDNFKNISKMPLLTDLHYPNYYRTQILTPELKKIARERLEKTLNKAKQRIQSGHLPQSYADKLQSLQGAVQFLEAEDHQELIPNFLRASLSKDKFRNQNLFLQLPELLPLKDFATQIL